MTAIPGTIRAAAAQPAEFDLRRRMTQDQINEWARAFFVAWEDSGRCIGDIEPTEFGRAAHLRDHGSTPTEAVNSLVNERCDCGIPAGFHTSDCASHV